MPRWTNKGHKELEASNNLNRTHTEIMAGKNEIGSEDTFEDKCEGWSKDGGVADVDREAVSMERGQ